MAWVAKDYIGEWIFNCKPDMWAGKTPFEIRDILSSANKLKRYDL